MITLAQVLAVALDMLVEASGGSTYDAHRFVDREWAWTYDMPTGSCPVCTLEWWIIHAGAPPT